MINIEKILNQDTNFGGGLYKSGLIKYEPTIYRDQKSQYNIISDQVSVLIDKIGQLIFHINHRSENKIKQLMDFVQFEQQKSYNKRFEYLISLILGISKAILEEFG